MCACLCLLVCAGKTIAAEHSLANEKSRSASGAKILAKLREQITKLSNQVSSNKAHGSVLMKLREQLKATVTDKTKYRTEVDMLKAQVKQFKEACSEVRVTGYNKQN